MRAATLLLFFLPSLIANAQSAPKGWRFPNKSDYRDNWQEFRKKVPMPYHVRIDLNGDGIKDDVWILIPTTGQGQGLFVFLGQKSEKPRVVKLDQSEDAAQSMYLSEIGPGRYKTACGKGYIDCAVGEPAMLRLAHSGIVYAMYESASSVFYWNRRRKEFTRVWLSD
jgi:hypothetical protein